MNKAIYNAIEKGRLILLIGAGASLSSKDKYGNQILSSNELAKRIAQEAGWEYNNENLQTVYAAARGDLGARLDDLFENLFKHCSPSPEYIEIAKHTWARIYTLNIDDAFDKALFRYSEQNINIRNRDDKIVDQDQLFSELDFIKLNGSIDRVNNGYIFSPKEYGESSAKTPLWYRELSQDFFRYTFIFVGTKLNEPLFFHQIERYKSETNISEQKSYVLTPSATEIEIKGLQSYNLEHIPGSLADFADWLKANFSKPLTPTEIAIKRNPALGAMLKLSDEKAREEYADIFKFVTNVNRLYLPSKTIGSEHDGKLRKFYRGFKPDWLDIVDEIPAEIHATKKFYSIVEKAIESDKKIVIAYGPAGSGKTTLLMQTALKIFDEKNLPVFFLNEPVNNLSQIFYELEKTIESRYCFFYDRLDDLASEIKSLIQNGIISKGIFIGSERQHRWESIVKEHLGDICDSPFAVPDIDKEDANSILEKLEKFGPWTRLKKMKYSQRIHELVTRSQRQLLIGLLETTYGIGYKQIIENEYSTLRDEDEKKIFTIVGFATYNRLSIKESLVQRALTNLSIEGNVLALVKKLSGILYYKHGNLLARHPVYVKQLFDSVIDIDDLYEVLMALLEAYTVYGAPVILKLNRKDGILFKSLMNHNFLSFLFRDHSKYVLGIYKGFEKDFESDGLYWLQYGLALRHYCMQKEALDTLQTAYEAHPMLHTEHALAQQEMIIAREVGSKAAAMDLLEKAKSRLERLDKEMRSEDTYPIVTLSEGHTEVIRVHEGEEAAKDLAKQYANILHDRIKNLKQDHRLKAAWVKLTTFATTGQWVEEKQMPFSC